MSTTTNIFAGSPLKRTKSAPALLSPAKAARSAGVRVDSYSGPRTPLCSPNTWRAINADCSDAKLRHDQFDLRSGIARGAATAQLIGIGLTVTGLLGGWALAAVGAGIMVGTVVFCVARYIMARRGAANAASRQMDAHGLELHLKGLRERLADPALCAAASAEEKLHAQEGVARLTETLAMLRGGPWYVTKRIVNSTVVGPIVGGLEILGRWTWAGARALKRSWDESQWFRQRSPRLPAQSNAARR